MWPALLVIAASMFAKHMATKEAQDRQSSMQGAMAAYQRGKAQENQAAIGQLLDKQTPQARAKELSDLTASRAASMQGTVDEARAASPVTAPAGTNTSADYQKASQAAATRVSDKTNRAISQLATMGAPGEQGVAQGIRFGRAAGTVDAGNQAIANAGDVYSRAINNVTPNPWAMMAGDAGMAIGGGMLAAPAAGAASVPAADAAAYEGGAHLGGGAAASAFSPSAAGAAARATAMRRAFSSWGR